MRHLWKNQDGMIMIEGLIVFTFTIFLLMMVLGMFTFLYQVWNIKSVANETAARLAQTYPYSEPASQAAMISGEISSSQALKLRPYRYLINKSGFEADAVERANSFAAYRLEGLLFNGGSGDIQIQTEIVSDSLARRHVEVTITSRFIVLFQAVMDGFGMGDAFTFTVTAYADCVDMLDYLNTVDFTRHATSLEWTGSKTLTFVNGILKLISKFV